jgi:hypothetical protein
MPIDPSFITKIWSLPDDADASHLSALQTKIVAYLIDVARSEGWDEADIVLLQGRRLFPSRSAHAWL